jgi:CBS domain-containing protein
MRIAEICSRDIACIDAAASVRQAASEMRRRHTGCLVVVDRRDAERVPRGVVTDRDIVVEVIAPGIDPNVLSVGDVMARPVATCREDDKLFDAVETMRLRGVRRLPVVGARGELVGLVSADDIMSALGLCLRELWQVGSRSIAREIETRS